MRGILRYSVARTAILAGSREPSTKVGSAVNLVRLPQTLGSWVPTTRDSHGAMLLTCRR